ncbi:MAG: hybrid sensor histidine kinase/response regulator [Acidobacteria bacterium]|nr:MAG: hybrid sensor histidine kinase/response regulator [Acidobacteriota bacterium]
MSDAKQSNRVDEKVHISDAQYRRLIENIPEVAWTADEQGNALFISEKIRTVFGYSSEEILQQGATLWFGRMHPDDRELVQKAYAALFSRGQAFDVEYRIQHREGRWMWWRDRAAMIEEAQGKRYADGLLSDITEHKNMEIQLRQAQKMEAVGQLAGGIAHDFNNLLCVLQGHAELAKDHAQRNPELLQHLEIIEETSRRAASLIQRLLAFSSKQVLWITVFDLNVIIAGIQKFLARAIGENIELSTRFHASPAFIKADRAQVEQILINLALNARDTMPEGGKLVIETCGVEFNEADAQQYGNLVPGLYVLLSISDTGRGINPETLEGIFDPFFTARPWGQGAGLGLATVYGIVKQSHGHISVDSKPDRGTTFHVYLPAQAVPLENGKEQAAIQILQGKESILIVEDEPQLRTLTRTWLQGLGYSVLEAASGSEAIKIVEADQSEIHLLLTDLIMPGLSGRQLAEQICLKCPSMNVVFMTGYTDDVVVQHKLLQSGSHLLRKPFTRADLARTVRAAIDKGQIH